MRRSDVARLTHVKGVLAAGRTIELGGASIATSAGPVDGQLVAADAGAVLAAGVPVVAGRLPADREFALRGTPTVAVGSSLARDLQLPPLATAPTVRVLGRDWTVVGIVGSGDSRADATRTVFVPWAAQALGHAESPSLVVRTQPGFQHHVAPLLPSVTLPTRPRELAAALPASPSGLRTAVDKSISQAATALAAVTLIGGLLALMQTTSSSVLRRTREIGLRRALGARRTTISAQIQLEAMYVGFWGSVAGAVLGALLGTVAARLSGWPAVVPAGQLAAGLCAGLVASAAAGIVPAWRASTIDPTDALRVD